MQKVNVLSITGVYNKINGEEQPKKDLARKSMPTINLAVQKSCRFHAFMRPPLF